MTVFTTSSPRQISFQIWFPYENPSQATHRLCWLNTRIHLHLCCVCNAERSSMKAPESRLKTIQLETAAGGRTQRQVLPGERRRRKSLLSPRAAVKAHSEDTVRTCSLGVVSLCRRNLGSFKWVSPSLKRGLIITFCILSPLHSSLGFVSTKSAKVVFFVVAQFSALVNQSGVAQVSAEWRNCWK